MSVARAVMRRLSHTIDAISTGTIPSDTRVSSQSRRSRTTIMPTRSTTDVRTEKTPFIVRVWMAKVSVVRR
jgi:hypothetical protein